MVQSIEFYTLYQTQYKKYTDLYGKRVCVFLKKGSFYELYGQQDPITKEQKNTVKEVIDFLGIALHVYPNDGPDGTTGLFGGVPEYTLDKWAGKLTKSGWTVVVMDEVKNESGKIVKREVSKILSPGTHVDSAEEDVFYISALWMENSKFGTVTADLTTGALYMYEGKNMDDLRHFFQVYSPREVLIGQRGQREQQRLEEDEIRQKAYLQTASIQTVNVSPENQGTLENPVIRYNYLQGIFLPKTALPLRTWLHIEEDSLKERALCVLLRYVEEHIPKLASCLQPPRVWHPEESMQIINNALSQLNLISTNQQGVKDLFCKPQTAMGRRELETRLCMPMTVPTHIRKRHDEIEWVLQNKEAQEQLDTCLILIYDLARLHRKIVRGTLEGEDILQLYQSYTSSQTIWELCLKNNSPFLEPNTIPSFLQESLEIFNSLFDIEKAQKAKKEEKEDELSFFKGHVSPKIEEVEKEIQILYKDANEWLSMFMKEYSLDSTNMYYKPTEKNMFSIHCTKVAMKSIEKKKLTTTYKNVHIKALTTSARMEHPDVEAFQVRLDIAKGKLHRLLCSEIPRVCIEYQRATQDFWFPIESWILNIDLAICMAKTANLYGFCRPVIEDTSNTANTSNTASGVWIENVRHPLIEIQKTKSRYVAHTIDLGYSSVENSSWLLYGMNASGKSSLMKAIGLSVLLAQVGSYVPATNMRLRPFKKLATRILNQDNLWAGLSSFAVEMSELRHIFEVADHETLVLGDELCSGTESVSATAIVAAGISWLHKCGARFVLATHLHDLMKLPEIYASPSLKAWHLHVEYDRIRDCLVYHRDLRPGSGSTLYGLEVAKALQLPPEMLVLAYEYRKRLLQETPLEKLQKSSWNKDIVKQACEVCSKKIESDLEVHHVQPREESEDGRRNVDGTNLHSVKNLAVLCTECHDKHHNGLITIGPVQDTSDGPKRILSLEGYRFKEKKKEKNSFTEEEIGLIKDTIKANNTLHKKLMIFQIQKEHGILLTETQLKKFLV